ncbi:BrnA antitoxin family protein [Parasphingorhabdus flavimaris]|uniref:BrnA antitoxin family protein n=1 Tax=Parasphingorhabdus flavimaris TaxID=266812 RepID=UPI003001487C
MKKISEKLASKLEKELVALEAMRDEDIDLSDAPEETDWSAAERGKFYRPVKEQVTLRLDADVLHWFKQSGKGYQTRINAALRRFVEADDRNAR